MKGDRIRVYEKFQDSWFEVNPKHWPELQAARTSYISDGVNTHLTLQGLCGGLVSFLISDVATIHYMTPEALDSTYEDDLILGLRRAEIKRRLDPEDIA